MEKMNDLKDLLKHEIMDLRSAEEQIIKAMPAMIEKAKNGELKQSLQQHLKVTEGQLARLDKVQQLMEGSGSGNAENAGGGGLLSRLFKRSHFCKGMEGIIDEGEKIMAEDMSPEVMDAAIIAASQKIEHYEICGYGTARAYAEELGLTEVASLLEQTLDEEYEADDRLTALAVNRLNQQAEKGSRRTAAKGNNKGSNPREKSGQRAPREAAVEPAAAKKSSAGRQTASKGSGQTLGSARSAANSSSAGNSRNTKGAAKGSAARGAQSAGRSGTSGSGGR